MTSHLELLRDEHLQLQLKLADLQKRYDILEASCAKDTSEKHGRLSKGMTSHLELLRDEHLQLQLKLADLQKRYDILEASCAKDTSEKHGRLSFVQKLVSTVAQLYDKDLYR
ncbi:unnamed protein product [Toxocara canis]|uniref:HOOK domain-containing protein n=1 Tax=Toxocara canis TaxID=6265 RepID=A0A183VHK8_TOXCA|nr:unnamed protein product [Toxocara canis]